MMALRALLLFSGFDAAVAAECESDANLYTGSITISDSTIANCCGCMSQDAYLQCTGITSVTFPGSGFTQIGNVRRPSEALILALSLDVACGATQPVFLRGTECIPGLHWPDIDQLSVIPHNNRRREPDHRSEQPAHPQHTGNQA
eukprot:7379851-Prymnesium_polylepis.1